VLDALLARGALFEDAVSAAPWTLPSYGSFFTGRFPTEHRAGVKKLREATWGSAACGVPFPAEDTENRLADALADDVVTMAEVFSAQGYRTAAFVNNPFLHPSFGVDDGFGQYAWYQPRADGGVALALAWIEREKDRPFFLFLHLMDPHMPYVPPDPWATRYTTQRIEDVPDYPFTRGDVNASADRRAYTQLLVDLYDAEIAYTDDCLAPLIAKLDETGLFANTIVVVHADHGEEFWEHDGFEHGHALNRETLHVPLGIVWPGHVPPVRVTERVRTIDVFPTLLELVGLPPSAAGFDRPASAELGARSLVPHVEAARGGKPLAPRDAYAEALLYGPGDADYAPWNEAKAGWHAGLAVVVGGPRGTERLHDVAADPLEREDLASERPDDTARMRERLERWHAELERAARSSDRATMTQEQKDAMGDLGYTGEDAAVEDGGGDAGTEPAAPPPLRDER
jgi:arylsulfatase A-like enzyme